jgi:hypothetical protein
MGLYINRMNPAGSLDKEATYTEIIGGGTLVL